MRLDVRHRLVTDQGEALRGENEDEGESFRRELRFLAHALNFPSGRRCWSRMT